VAIRSYKKVYNDPVRVMDREVTGTVLLSMNELVVLFDSLPYVVLYILHQ